MSLGLVVAALSSSVPVVDLSSKVDSLVTCWSVMTSTGNTSAITLLEFLDHFYRECIVQPKIQTFFTTFVMMKETRLKTEL